jgi:hypothetical protein
VIIVNITSQLKQKLSGSLTPEKLIERFINWKSGEEYSSYWFGHNKIENGLTHVHMAPVTDGDSKTKWNYWWLNNRPHLRRSYCYLLYAYDKLYGYLLIDVLFDPGAHNLWKPNAKQQLENYETVADNFIYNGTFP